MKKRDVTSIFQTPIAHRGFHFNRTDENTLDAFSYALERGYGIELDVRLTADGQVVVYHDHTLSRLNGIDASVETSSLVELQRHRFLRSKQIIPTLQQVLSLVEGRVPLLIELKYDDAFSRALADRVLEELKRYRYPETIALQSFNPSAVRYLNLKKKVIYPVGQLTSHRIAEQNRLVNRLYATAAIRLWSKPDFIAYDVNGIPNRHLIALRKKGHRVIGWTVDTPEKLLKAKLYCDQFIFEKLEFS